MVKTKDKRKNAWNIHRKTTHDIYKSVLSKYLLLFFSNIRSHLGYPAMNKMICWLQVWTLHPFLGICHFQDLEAADTETKWEVWEVYWWKVRGGKVGDHHNGFLSNTCFLLRNIDNPSYAAYQSSKCVFINIWAFKPLHYKILR